jgi:hypothetical protein
MLVARITALSKGITRNREELLKQVATLIPLALARGWKPTPEQLELDFIKDKIPAETKPSASVKKIEAKNKASLGRQYHDLMADFYVFCEYLPIKYRPGMLKDFPLGGVGPLRPTSAQRKVLNFIIKQLLYDHVPVRIILLKSRQLGCTTILLAFWLWLMLKYGNYHVFFIIDKGAHSAEKLDTIERWMGALKEAFPDDQDLPVIVKKNPHLLLSNNSIFFYESAEAPNPGTSEMLNAVHISEGPKYPRGRMSQLTASIKPALPIAPLTISVNEFTAQGLDDCYLAFEKAREEGTPTPIFLGWFLSDEYSLPVPPGRFEYSLAKEHGDGEQCPTEEEYAKKYKLTPGQVLWRRHRISVDFEGQRVVFDQEHPTTIEHAWRNSAGGNHFGKAVLDFYQKKSRDGVRYNIHNALYPLIPSSPTGAAIDCQPILVEDNFGEFEIWRHPHDTSYGKHQPYFFCGVDVCEGKEPTLQSGEKEPDWTVFYITDDLGNLCARYRTHIKPEDAWIPLLLLSVYYQAIVNAERNGPGNVLWSWFKLCGYNKLTTYPNAGRGNRPVEDRTWTYLSGPTIRKEVLSNLRKRLGQSPDIPCEVVYSEMRTFFNNPKTGKAEAASYAHDDCVMALAHAYWAQAVEEGTIEVAGKMAPPQVEEEIRYRPKVSEPGIDRGFFLQDTDFFDQLPGFVFVGGSDG